MDLTPSYLILALLVGCYALWPDETTIAIQTASLKIQLYYLNYRMKFLAWQQYRMLVRMAKDAGMPSPGPFTFVNLWDRKDPS